MGERCTRTPERWPVDGGYPAHGQIKTVSDRTTVLAPAPQSKKANSVDPHQRKAGDSPAVAAWRARIATDAAKQRYKNRAASAD